MTEEFRPRTCYFCGEGTIAVRNVRGHELPYKDARAVRIEQDVEVPTCDICGEMLPDEAATGKLEKALSVSYASMRRRQLLEEIDRILAELDISQTELERILGVSPGYVSKIKTGRRTPEPVLFRFLHLLNSDPRAAVRSLAEVAPIDDIVSALT